MKFYDIKQLNNKLYKVYEKGDLFLDYIEKKSLFPLVIPLKKIQQKDIQNSYIEFTKELQSLQNTQFPLLYKEYNFKTLGRQKLPVSIKIETLNEFLYLLDKEAEYEIFTQLYAKIIKKYPTLKILFLKKPFFVLQYYNEWDKFFLILNFFLQNKQNNLYIREISLQDIDTKYIQKHTKIIDMLLCTITQTDLLCTLSEYSFEKRYHLKYPLPQIRFRILDKDLYIAGLSDIMLTVEEFKNLNIACKRVFIVENQITTLAFGDIKESIVIFGSGYKVGVLKNVKWLEEKILYYWGDIDADGFAILSQMRGYFPKIQSLCMDEKTFETFKHYAVKDIKAIMKELKYLKEEEKKLYSRLKNQRLEQERIPFEWFFMHSKI